MTKASKRRTKRGKPPKGNKLPPRRNPSPGNPLTPRDDFDIDHMLAARYQLRCIRCLHVRKPHSFPVCGNCQVPMRKANT